MKRILLIIVTTSLILLFNMGCALEIANVLGPDGGYVFYDKGSYNYGWRYIQCSPYDFGEIKGNTDNTDNTEAYIRTALKLCTDNNANWHKFGWEIPDEAALKKMLECFSYGLTRFSSDFYYLAVNNLYDAGRWWVCGFQYWECGKLLESTGKLCLAKNQWPENWATTAQWTDSCAECGATPSPAPKKQQCLKRNTGKFCFECGKPPSPGQGWVEDKNDPPNPNHLKDPLEWELVILHKNFDNAANGAVERVEVLPEIIRLRAIRRF